MAQPHVVFVSHDASRTGAPIFLLHLLEWLRDNTDWSFELICQRGGPLVSRFRRVCPVTTYRLRRRLRWLTPLLFWRGASWLRARVERSQPDLIYYNTVASREVHAGLAPLDLPSIVHVHELEASIQYYGPDTVTQVEQSRPEYIAASGAVARNLAARHAIPTERLSVVHEFIRLPRVSTDDPTVARAALCDRLGIPRESILVGGMGSIVQRKGVDLFVDAARQLRKQAAAGDRPIHFVWLGGGMDRRYSAQIRATIRREGLGDLVHLAGQVTNPLAIVQHFDVFTLTSREDPYPLAMLEAAALGVPIIGFADSGGAPEFIQGDAGIVVPFEDTTALAHAIEQLTADPARARAMGAIGAARVRSRHTTEAAATQIFKAINRQVARSSEALAARVTRPVPTGRLGRWPRFALRPAPAC